MRCPKCGEDILDPDPTFCPRCGFEIAMSGPGPREGPIPVEASSPSDTQDARVRTNARGVSIGAKYYLMPLLAIVGGAMGYRAVKKRNPRVAATIFTMGLLISLVYIGVGFEVYSRVTGSPGVYDLSIGNVEFHNSTSIVVTVANRGTITDGLESVAINNGSLWLVYGLLEPNSTRASSEIQSGMMSFDLYGYIVNGTTVPASSGGIGTVGTEGFPPSHTAVITIDFDWAPGRTYLVAITTSSLHPNEVNATSPA